MNPFLSFLVGPFGAAFAVMNEYRFLPSTDSFTEFSDEMYEAYLIKEGKMPSERLFQMHADSNTNEKEVLVVTKTEMEEFLKARQFVDHITLEKDDLKDASDVDRLDYFMKLFPILFPDKPQEEHL